jgi:asparagine synthase (glutamine-hydrolysing)
MCGILGAISSTNDTVFKHALDSIAHRGPDGYGIWQSDDKSITLGHRRLAILDLSDQGKQPMHFGKYAITLNGEIYNFIEVRKELQAKGYQFHTESDTEVVLAAFQEWKQDCLHKFNGMWAFAIWNKEEKELFISRDRFGKKPLFYAFINDQFVFASEMKAIFPFLPEVKPSKDFDWCKNNVFNYEATEKCLIDGIKRFPAGSYATIKPGQTIINPTRYWNTLEHLVEVPKTYNEQVEKFRELFIDSCKIRMRSDVPIGTALSGGLDSSATICTMAHIGQMNSDGRVSKDWQHAFVATFPGTFLDESIYAKKVADFIGVTPTLLPIDPARGIENLFEYQYLFEELYITSPIPMVELYRSVKQNNVTVTIDGHGADELLGGYGKNIYKAFRDIGLNYKQIKDILNTYKGTSGLDHFQASKSAHLLSDYLNYMVQENKGGKNLVNYYLKDTLGLIKRENPQKGEFGFFNSYLFEIFHSTVLPTLLRNYDRYSMASGVEIRMPFMDHRLVSYCFSLSWKSKLRNGYTKAIVRDALKDMMPADIAFRKSKIGFNTPIVDWIKNDWKEFLQDEMSSTGFRNCTLIETQKVTDKVQEVMKNPNATFRDGEEAWKGLMPYIWEKSVIKPASWKR